MIEMGEVRQVPGDYLRRWFCDADFDLTAWYKPDGSIHGFQLSYDKTSSEKSVTWLGGCVTHHQVDAGEDSPLANRAPILIATDGRFRMSNVLVNFMAADQDLPPQLRKIVRKKLREYGGLPVPWVERWPLILALAVTGSIAFVATVSCLRSQLHGRKSNRFPVNGQ